MKHLRLLLTFAVALFGLAAMADDIDETFVFVDEAGNVIENGSEITVKGLTPETQYDDAFISSGLYVRASEDMGASLQVTLTRMDSGSISCCFPSVCSIIESLGTTETAKGMVYKANGDLSIQTEWYPIAYGTCTAELEIMVYEAGLLNPGGFVASGPHITINFVYDETSAGIDGVNADESEVVAYYTLDGRQLDAPQPGVNVVKYANGKSVKTIYK